MREAARTSEASRTRIGSRDANDRAAVRPVPARENDGPVKRCAHGGTDMS